MSKSLFVVVATIAAALPAAGHAAAVSAQQFGAREDISQISLSPDGKRVAMLRAIKGAGTAVVVADLTTGALLKPILASSGRPDQLKRCDWSTPTRLICTITTMSQKDGADVFFSRMLTVNSDGTDLKELSGETRNALYGAAQYGGSVVDWLADGDTGSTVLMTRMYGEQETTGTLLASKTSGLGVERVNTITLRRQQTEQPKSSAVEYMTDGHGTVRLTGLMPANDSGILKGQIKYYYRKINNPTWLPLSTLTIGTAGNIGFDPQAIDRNLNVVYGFDDRDGRAALYKVALDGSMKRELVLDNPEVDVDNLISIGRQHRVVGASFATDKRQTVFFDPGLKALGESLGKALPGKPIIDFVDASADEQQLLLFAGSDTDPGRFYVFDRTTRKLAEILPVRPQLDKTKLATVTPITFKAADGTTIPGYLTLPPGSDGKGLPAIVMPHGGPEARDEWGFDWLSQFFANRGYAVLQPNFRGSSGYGNQWFQKNGFQSWRTAIGDVNDAGHFLIASGVTAPDKLAIFGWSYGGYAALQSAVLDPSLFKAIVAVAPVTDLETLRGESRNFTNSRMVDAFIGHGPEVRAGSPAQNVDRIAVPVLLFHGDMDQNVGVAESRLMASRLHRAGKPVDYVEYKGLTHQLDDSDVRAEMLDKSDAFLRRTLSLK